MTFISEPSKKSKTHKKIRYAVQLIGEGLKYLGVVVFTCSFFYFLITVLFPSTAPANTFLFEVTLGSLIAWITGICLGAVAKRWL
jgi:hypothetical protein